MKSNLTKFDKITMYLYLLLFLSFIFAIPIYTIIEHKNRDYKEYRLVINIKSKKDLTKDEIEKLIKNKSLDIEIIDYYENSIFIDIVDKYGKVFK